MKVGGFAGRLLSKKPSSTENECPTIPRTSPTLWILDWIRIKVLRREDRPCIDSSPKGTLHRQSAFFLSR